MKKKLFGTLLALALSAGMLACGRTAKTSSHQQGQSGQDADHAQEVDYIKEKRVEVDLGDELKMPENVDVVYTDHSMDGPSEVTWDGDQVGKIDTKKAGKYVIDGTLEDGTAVTCQVIVAKRNWLLNPGFEKNDISMWEVSYEGDSNPTDIQANGPDARSGVNSFHFESGTRQEFQIQQTVPDLKAGNYTATVHIRGGNVGKRAKIFLYAMIGGKMIRSEFVRLGRLGKWKMPKVADIKLDGSTEVTIGVKVTCRAGGWGFMDDFALVKEDSF